MRSGNPERDGGPKPTTISFEEVDLTDPASKLHLIRAVAAIMNANGGRISIGVDSGGRELGVDEAVVDSLTAAAVGAAVDPFISPDSVALDVRPRPVGDDRSVIEIDVAAPAELPVVLTASGEYVAADGSGRELFPTNSVLIHHNGRTRPAGRAEFRRWTSAAVERERSRLADQFQMVLTAPAGARLRFLADEEVHDDPSYFLSRATDLFRQRPERVLDGGDLQYLWLHRSSLNLDRAASELLVQTALRKRATLFLWLAVLDLSASELKAQLWSALGMRDRDKSDAARSILQVASLIVTEDDYGDLQRALAASDYTHMRTAAEMWPRPLDARNALATAADRSLRGRSDAELLAVADEIVAAGGSAVLRQAPPIGLEVFTRKLERSVRA
jgi:hypothetical protein